MNKNILMPDYNNSILNLVISILNNYGVESKYKGLNKLDEYLKHKYTNIVLIVLDGMGVNILKGNVPNGFFNENKIDNITSVYPSTTTAAMTTYYSGKPPIETGWLGWSQYFKEYGRCINPLPCTDSYTKENFECEKLNIKDILKYKTIFEIIKEENKNIKIYELLPKHCAKRSNEQIYANNMDELVLNVESLCKCKNKDKKFIMAYLDSPDLIIHKYGCYSKETKNFILDAQSKIKKMCKKLEGTDTLIIVSSDHGHNDIEERYNILELEDIQDCLIMPPFLEERFISFFVKNNMKTKFEKTFNSKFKNKYILYTKEEFLKSNLLGCGKPHKKIDDFIGDYIAIAISNTVISIGTYISKQGKKSKSKHCGLTKNEMEVPLIVLDLK